MRFNSDVKLQHRLKFVIGEGTLVQPGVLIPHSTLNPEAAVYQRHTLRQGPIISRGKHTHTKENQMLQFTKIKIWQLKAE